MGDPTPAEEPRRDTWGIVNAPELLRRVSFRRRLPAPGLRPYLEHYWLIDWDLDQPHLSQVVPHPSVNLVFERRTGRPPHGLVAGVGLRLFTTKLEERGRVCGVQFRPGGFRPFWPTPGPVSALADRHLPWTELFPGSDPGVVDAVLEPADEEERVAALDRFLLGLCPEPDPQAFRAVELVQRVRGDREIRTVGQLAGTCGWSVRSVQRLFAEYVGVSPKWVILQYRVHEALERATRERGVRWAELAAELGYSDQPHLVREFTTAVGVTPTGYLRALDGGF
ncbi:AraC family transcriptional regulator [Streptomyces sp. NPDC005438]|uniref:AraC family transcriptional regulator n=1 Tax=Streptomyces sp. NPDC005438 TaxID=3156880 RepID=UPI0033AC96A9